MYSLVNSNKHLYASSAVFKDTDMSFQAQYHPHMNKPAISPVMAADVSPAEQRAPQLANKQM